MIGALDRRYLPMLRDLNELQAETLPDYDLCIIGSGPAGMTLAAELVDAGLRIAVLESGRLTVSSHGDSLRPVESEGIFIKDYSRERVLGGASTTWAGLAAPLDEIDFSDRPWLERSGWPISRDELKPYWAAAAERYRFPTEEFFGSGGFGGLRAKSEIQPRWKLLEEKIFLAAAQAQNFGREWRQIFDGDLLDAWLDATVLELVSDPETSKVQAALVKTRSGREFRLQAKTFVLATGGIENARLLLNSQSQCDAGLGNEQDQVGRYLMNHPKKYHGILRLSRPTGDLPFYYGCLYRGFAGYAGLRLREDYQREKKLLNSYVRLEPMFPWTDSEGVEALVLFAKHSSFLMKRWTQGKPDEVVSLRDYSETGDDSEVQNARKSIGQWIALALRIPLDAPSVLRYLKYRLITKAKPPINEVRIRNFMEMEPHGDNRVVLTDQRDSLGALRPKVIHDTTDKDRRALIELHKHLKQEFLEQEFGELITSLDQADPWPINEEASHHLGTTRMGVDPATSVVNSDLRVHTAQNVYIAGGSVFPTSGCANPTFTICALSIRLAQHLRSESSASTARGNE
ncbi:MAG: choline dehydrogenase-like flavoprotein [Candidatus Paceibacteria bacterium]